MDIIVIIVWWFMLPLCLTWGLTLVSRRGKKLPPGPATFPIIGNIHSVGDKPHISLAKLAKIHGPIMSLKLGRKTVIVISSSAVAEEVLWKHDLDMSDRTVPDVLNAQNHSKYSVVWLPVGPGPEWKLLRKIMAAHIFSASRLDESQRLWSQKVNDLISYCSGKRETGDAVDIGLAGFRTILNLMSNIMFSRDLTNPLSDSKNEFKDLVWEMVESITKPNMVDFFPVLRRLDPQGARRRMDVMMVEMLKLIRSLITERIETRIHGSPSKDLLDDLLDLNREDPEQMNQNLIEHFLIDLFATATDSTSVTIEWAMAELLKNPGTLKRLQAELGEVTGRGRVIHETDLPRLPYLHCVLKETLRIHPPGPFTIRKARRDLEVFGYIIPAEAQVLVNLQAIGREEATWEDPLVFKPDRFHEMERDFKGQDFEYLPFGAGRRMCPAAPLAVKSLSVLIGSLVNVYDWKLEGGIAPEELDMEEKFGLSLLKAKPLRAIPLAIQDSWTT